MSRRDIVKICSVAPALLFLQRASAEDAPKTAEKVEVPGDLTEKGKKVALFGAALVAADVIAGLVYGKSVLGVASGKVDPTNWKTRLVDSFLAGQQPTVQAAMAQAREALAAGDFERATAILTPAAERFAAEQREEDWETARELKQLQQKALFTKWKQAVEIKSARGPAELQRLAQQKMERRATARELLTAENAELDAKTSRGRAKEAGDQGYMRAEDLVREGRFDEARAELVTVEANWAKAGMLGLNGRPFEAAIDGLKARMESAAQV